MTSKKDYEDWKKFGGNEIPSSLEPFPLLYDKISKNCSIVDIGCGAGKVVFDLAGRGYGPVTGFDINESGIKSAVETVADSVDEAVRDLCRFECRDATATGYDDGRFDYGVMQAVMTTLTEPKDRLDVLRESRRIISKGMYMAVFMQTWNNSKMRERYEQGIEETGEVGTFNVCTEDGKDTLYKAHHYSKPELVELLTGSRWRIDTFRDEIFTTRTGNKVNGAVLWVVPQSVQ